MSPWILPLPDPPLSFLLCLNLLLSIAYLSPTTIPSCIFTSIYSNSFRTAILIGVLLHIITSWCAFKCLWLRNTIWTRGVSLVKKHRPTRVGVIFLIHCSPLDGSAVKNFYYHGTTILGPRKFLSEVQGQERKTPRSKQRSNTTKNNTKTNTQKRTFFLDAAWVSPGERPVSVSKVKITATEAITSQPQQTN